MKASIHSLLNKGFLSIHNMVVIGNILLCALLLYGLGAMAGHFVHLKVLALPVQSSKPVRLPKTSLPPDPGADKQKFIAFLDQNIFKVERKEQPKDDISPEELAAKAEENKKSSEPFLSKLKIELRGTVVDPNKQSSYAFIVKQGNNQERIVGIGDCFVVPDIKINIECPDDSVKVSQIEDRKVAVMYQGAEEWMTMQTPAEVVFQLPNKTQENSAAKTRSQKKAQPKRTEASSRAPEPRSLAKKESTPKTEKSAAEPVSSDQETFHLQREWVDEQLKNFAQILQDARVVPKVKEGKTYFQFKYIRKESMYQALGLVKNDIIVSINGTLIDNVTKAMGLLQKLQSEREIELMIEREGVNKVLRYYIN
ncbi:MAG: hypothetical protein HQM14_07030 [SAR324 cluster bacterium]|nr:hypothetical protein [SAR324 cluster bacterium]